MTEQEKNHIGNSLLFMCRYSYNRKTGADMACNSALKALWKYIPNTHRTVILEEIEAEAPDLAKGRFSIWYEFLQWEKQHKKGEEEL